VSSPFPRTLRALRGDRSALSTWALAVAALLLVAWLAWFALARVSVRAVSAEARIEVERSVHPVEAPVAGRVRDFALELGQPVERGATLVQLDARELELELDAEQRRLAALRSQLDALREEVAVRGRARAEAREAGAAALAEARKTLENLELTAELAAEEYARIDRLDEFGGISEFELARSRLEDRKARTAVDGQRIALERLALDQRILDGDRAAVVAALESDARRLEGELVASEGVLERLDHAIERHAIRAPADGEVGEIAEVAAGSIVARGERLGAVVSRGRLYVVARFAPHDALGRIRPGQAARVRLAGFPWSQYGTLPARVESVGSEADGGTVRVELALDDPTAARVPLQHGLPGSVEVEVEAASPLELVLRSAGRWVGGDARASGAARRASPTGSRSG